MNADLFTPNAELQPLYGRSFERSPDCVQVSLSDLESITGIPKPRLSEAGHGQRYLEAPDGETFEIEPYAIRKPDGRLVEFWIPTAEYARLRIAFDHQPNEPVLHHETPDPQAHHSARLLPPFGTSPAQVEAFHAQESAFFQRMQDHYSTLLTEKERLIEDLRSEVETLKGTLREEREEAYRRRIDATEREQAYRLDAIEKRNELENRIRELKTEARIAGAGIEGGNRLLERLGERLIDMAGETAPQVLQMLALRESNRTTGTRGYAATMPSLAEAAEQSDARENPAESLERAVAAELAAGNVSRAEALITLHATDLTLANGAPFAKAVIGELVELAPDAEAVGRYLAPTLQDRLPAFAGVDWVTVKAMALAGGMEDESTELAYLCRVHESARTSLKSSLAAASQNP